MVRDPFPGVVYGRLHSFYHGRIDGRLYTMRDFQRGVVLEKNPDLLVNPVCGSGGGRDELLCCQWRLIEETRERRERSEAAGGVDGQKGRKHGRVVGKKEREKNPKRRKKFDWCISKSRDSFFSSLFPFPYLSLFVILLSIFNRKKSFFSSRFIIFINRHYPIVTD